MEGISRVTTRILEIQSRFGVGPSFAASLERAVLLSTPPVSSRSELETFLSSRAVRERNGLLEGSGLITEITGGWEGRRVGLLEPAAQAWEALRAAAAADGIILWVVDAYRSREQQADAYRAFLAGDKQANVLPPGESEHGNGLAVDITNGKLIGPGDREWAWLTANAARFGWYPIANEPWHWEFRGLPG